MFNISAIILFNLCCLKKEERKGEKTKKKKRTKKSSLDRKIENENKKTFTFFEKLTEKAKTKLSLKN